MSPKATEADSALFDLWGGSIAFSSFSFIAGGPISGGTGVTGIATCSFAPEHNTLIGCCSSPWPASCWSSWIVHILWSISLLPECLWARESAIWPRDTELKESVFQTQGESTTGNPLTADSNQDTAAHMYKCSVRCRPLVYLTASALCWVDE